MFLAQQPSWLNSLDDWLIILFVLILPALGKVAQWVRDLQQERMAKGSEEQEIDGELLDEFPKTSGKSAGRYDSLPQPFEPASTQSDRMERVPPPPQTNRPAPATAWKPGTGSMTSPTPIPTRPQPVARPAPTRPVESPKRTVPIQKQPPRRTDAQDAPRESQRRKATVRDVVERIARNPTPRTSERKPERGRDESVPQKRKPTAAPSPVEKPQESDSSPTALGRLDRNALRQAFILREILDPPVGMR